ncbi:hypothetical protein BX266_5581 [Streptomyces sp. TLI_171]|nr:hypothetical protein BX266_5484 [Streptomyces sp. TLI_171]RKE22150.1 hypothetical protein BX266_5581 [Streptomyces sp. TLI_171]
MSRPRTPFAHCAPSKTKCSKTLLTPEPAKPTGLNPPPTTAATAALSNKASVTAFDPTLHGWLRPNPVFAPTAFAKADPDTTESAGLCKPPMNAPIAPDLAIPLQSYPRRRNPLGAPSIMNVCAAKLVNDSDNASNAAAAPNRPTRVNRTSRTSNRTRARAINNARCTPAHAGKNGSNISRTTSSTKSCTSSATNSTLPSKICDAVPR